MRAEQLGIYIHIPFCTAICHYCNFNRGLLDETLKVAYLEGLTAEIARVQARPRADTVYFGGGTPSLLSPDEVARILDVVAHVFHLDADAEISMEANPETVDAARVAGFRRAGVNRLSIGVQSFRDAELVRLGRVHDGDGAAAAYRTARAAGFSNVNLDLMMWLPGQSVEQWYASVDALIALEPDHASLYMLELYPNAPLRDTMARGQWTQAPDENAAAMYLGGLERLDAAGYAQYEISSVATPGHQCRHNLKYWSDGEWLGFGCGAHSTRDGVRWKGESAIEAYIARVAAGEDPAGERRRLNQEDRAAEALFTGLRLADGLDVSRVERRYGMDVGDRFGPALEPFLESGLLRRQGPRFWLTREGMLLSNEVMAAFVRPRRTGDHFQGRQPRAGTIELAVDSASV